jgi:hypothetical protein
MGEQTTRKQKTHKLDVTFDACIFTSNTHIGSCFRSRLMQTTMDWTGRSLDSSDDAFYSLPSSSHVSLNSATHDAEVDMFHSPSIEQARFSGETRSSVLDANIHNENKYSKHVNPSSTACSVSRQRDNLRDGNATILSRIKQGLTMPLGIFTHQQGNDEKFEVPQHDGKCPDSGSNYGGGGDVSVLESSVSTPRCLSRIEAGFVFDSASHTKLINPSLVYRSDSPSVVSGWSNNTPLSFSDFTNSFGKPFECNNSPVSLGSTVPSPLFSEIGAHSTPPWSPTTPLEIHTRAQTCIDDRKRQSSAGSLQIKDNHGHHRAEGRKGKEAAPPLVCVSAYNSVSNKSSDNE